MRKEHDHKKPRLTTTPFMYSRRRFLGGLCAISIATGIPAVVSCSVRTSYKDPHGQLTENDMQVLSEVQNILFPGDLHTPSAKDVAAGPYFTWVLSDENIDPDIRSLMRKGIKWTDETAEELFSSKFIDLPDDEKESVVAHMAGHGWGERWLSVVLTYLFEALFSDPVYGANIDEKGWKWIDHRPGQPRPTKKTRYKP